MITRVEFSRFRGFAQMRAEMVPHAYIVGPNSAGKSTVLEAIGLAEQCLRIARRKTTPIVVIDQGVRRRAFPLPTNVDDEEDPVRHEFAADEARVTVQWDSGGRIHMVWPQETEEGVRGFFYLEERGGSQPLGLPLIRSLFSPVSIVPVVTPIDRLEDLKNTGYVEIHANSRLASRHFRNNLLNLSRSGQWEEFKEFCQPWLPEIELLDVTLDSCVNRLTVFYSETGSRVPKELSWAGDGIQIWVQLLWHIFRAQDATTILLDEPEVYLHPDLQRRLVRLLDGLSAQIILASHSADVIAEAPPDGILWVDRRQGAARRVKSQQSLSNLSASLGSSYNLALARSMRARLVIASDSEDLRILRVLAKNLGASHVANEQEVSIVQLRNVSHWEGTRDLGMSLREILPPRLPAVIMLQSGHRPEIYNQRIAALLSAPEITVKIWQMTELENYLLDADTVARASGAAPETVALRLAEVCNGLRETTRAALTSAWVGAAQEGQGLEALRRAEVEFDEKWSDPAKRMELVRGTLVIREINLWLTSQGYRAVNGYKLAKAIKPQAIPLEMVRAIIDIDGRLV